MPTRLTKNPRTDTTKSRSCFTSGGSTARCKQKRKGKDGKINNNFKSNFKKQTNNFKKYSKIIRKILWSFVAHSKYLVTAQGHGEKKRDKIKDLKMIPIRTRTLKMWTQLAKAISHYGLCIQQPLMMGEKS